MNWRGFPTLTLRALNCLVEDVERFNRRYVLFAVVGAAGLALGVDKFVLSDGLTSPSSASASQAPSDVGTPAAAKAQAQDVAKTASPAMKLEVYRKSSDAHTAAAPRDAMKHQGWISTSSAKDGAATNAVSPTYKHMFKLTGVAGGAVRLSRTGDPELLKRGQLLRVGQTVNWSKESGAVVTLVSIAPDNQSVVIEVDGDRREVRLHTDARPESVVRTSNGSASPSENP